MNERAGPCFTKAVWAVTDLSDLASFLSDTVLYTSAPSADLLLVNVCE